jgi:hypothetical protein
MVATASSPITAEQVQIAGSVLIGRAPARHNEPAIERRLYYVQFGKLIDPDGSWRYPQTQPEAMYRGMGQLLGLISEHEHAAGRPLLSALVVTRDTGLPGDGFFVMAHNLGFQFPDTDAGRRLFWQEQVEAVVAYWTAKIS